MYCFSVDILLRRRTNDSPEPTNGFNQMPVPDVIYAPSIVCDFFDPETDEVPIPPHVDTIGHEIVSILKPVWVDFLRTRGSRVISK